jgi:hypothetical protein
VYVRLSVCLCVLEREIMCVCVRERERERVREREGDNKRVSFFKGPALNGNFRTFRFREFQKCSVFEVRKFFGKNRNIRTHGIFAKKFGKISEI